MFISSTSPAWVFPMQISFTACGLTTRTSTRETTRTRKTTTARTKTWTVMTARGTRLSTGTVSMSRLVRSRLTSEMLALSYRKRCNGLTQLSAGSLLNAESNIRACLVSGYIQRCTVFNRCILLQRGRRCYGHNAISIVVQCLHVPFPRCELFPCQYPTTPNAIVPWV
jgi:hypothetical protein